jgi:hypothetical protein
MLKVSSVMRIVHSDNSRDNILNSKNSNTLNILVSGDASGRVVLSAFGTFCVGIVEMSHKLPVILLLYCQATDHSECLAYHQFVTVYRLKMSFHHLYFTSCCSPFATN